MTRCPLHPDYDGRIAPPHRCAWCDRVWVLVRLRANAIGLALLAAALVLDVVCPLHAPRHTGAFFGIFVAIFEAVSWAFHAFASTAAAALLAAYQFLRTGFINLAKVVKTGLFEAGRATARLIRPVRGLWDHVLEPGLKWANDKLLRLERWLHDKFAPVLTWLHDLKARLDAFYNTYIRPITDTINFLRILNRTLETFHIHLLAKLDDVLMQIEQRLEDPFDWIRKKITWAENWIDVIITADGVFRYLTFIRSQAEFVGSSWRVLYNARSNPISAGERSALRERNAPPKPDELRAKFERYVTTGSRGLLTEQEEAALNETVFGSARL